MNKDEQSNFYCELILEKSYRNYLSKIALKFVVHVVIII